MITLIKTFLREDLRIYQNKYLTYFLSIILLISNDNFFGDLLMASGCEGGGFLFGLTKLSYR